MPFYDRKKETNLFKDFFDADDFKLFILYGRRRVGKTYLLKHCTQNRKGIFFSGRQISSELLLDFFSQEAAKMMNMTGIHFRQWEEAFDFVFSHSEKIHYLVLDEFQYMVEAASEIPSVLQTLIDHKETKLKLLLCGSSISFMHGLLSYNNPLYGRKTNYLKLQPVKFTDLSEFIPVDCHSLMDFYAVFGGIPLYLEMIDPEKKLFENIQRLFLNIDSPLREEPLFLLSQELREPRVYLSILEAISFGYNRSGEIASKIGYGDSRKIQPYLDTLKTLDLIKKEVPITEKNPQRSRKGIYKIKDHLFAFWFRFIYPNLHFIENEQIAKVFGDLETNISQFSSFVFEEVARDFLLKHFQFDKIGNYWRKDIEIDIMAQKGDKWVVGECKWRKRKFGYDEYNQLVQKSSKLPYPVDQYILVSKSGFDDRLFDLENVILVEFTKEKGFVEL
jgi:AAA+ ATPase superfamily predicted ATPase